MVNIYELTGDWMRIWDYADDPDVDEDTFWDTLLDIEEGIHTKADGYARVMKGMDGTISVLDAEIKRLQQKKKVIENRQKAMKYDLQKMMETTGEKKFKTDLFSFCIQKNPASLKLADDLDIADVPEEYIKYADPEVDKAKVKEALSRGEEFEWARLEQSESLRIR